MVKLEFGPFFLKALSDVTPIIFGSDILIIPDFESSVP